MDKKSEKAFLFCLGLEFIGLIVIAIYLFGQ